MEYVVWVEQPDGRTGGSARAEFESPLTVGSTVEHGGRQCIVIDVDEAERPVHRLAEAAIGVAVTGASGPAPRQPRRDEERLFGRGLRFDDVQLAVVLGRRLDRGQQPFPAQRVVCSVIKPTS